MRLALEVDSYLVAMLYVLNIVLVKLFGLFLHLDLLLCLTLDSSSHLEYSSYFCVKLVI